MKSLTWTIFNFSGLLFILTLFPVASVLAQGAGDLIVSPTRIVFEGRDRTASITLANRGSESSVFRISFLDMEMTNEGQLQQLQDESTYAMSAQKLVRFAPRQITLAPGATQVVRFSLRKPTGLSNGEYRSHIFFRAVPPESAGRNITDDTPLGNNELRIQLTPIYGITIPMIVRHGEVSAELSFSDAKILPKNGDTPLRLDVTLHRTGEGSAFGDIQATYIPADGSERIVIGQISRLAIYTEIQDRRVVMPLTIPQDVILSKGEIELLYRQLEDKGGATLASTTITLE